jgi:hypothetical protein
MSSSSAKNATAAGQHSAADCPTRFSECPENNIKTGKSKNKKEMFLIIS